MLAKRQIGIQVGKGWATLGLIVGRLMMSCSPNIVAWCTFKVPPRQTPRTLLYQARPCAAYGRGLGTGARILKTEQVCLNEACLLKLLPCLQSALGT